MLHKAGAKSTASGFVTLLIKLLQLVHAGAGSSTLKATDEWLILLLALTLTLKALAGRICRSIVHSLLRIMFHEPASIR